MKHIIIPRYIKKKGGIIAKENFIHISNLKNLSINEKTKEK